MPTILSFIPQSPPSIQQPQRHQMQSCPTSVFITNCVQPFSSGNACACKYDPYESITEWTTAITAKCSSRILNIS